tara:strand:- start:3658 stop:5607 length:1950 start_codon:yes stop_codon:yes gene_type:complete
MAKKPTLNDIAANGFAAISTYNSNQDAIEAAFNNTLSRDGSSPNYMEADLDMNSNRIINLADPTLNQDAATKAYMDAKLAEIASLSASPYYVTATGSTTPRTIADRFGEYFNVLDYGGVGDGTTDDRAAINAAITAANTAGGGTVIVPAGYTFLTNGSVVMKSNVAMTGGGTIKLGEAQDVDVINGAGVSDAVIYGIIIDGNYANQSSSAGGIVFESADDSTTFERVYIRDCQVKNVYGTGIEVNGGKWCRVIDNTVRDCSFHGIQIASDVDADSQYCTAAHNSVENIGGAGIIAMGDSLHNSIIGNHITDWNSDDYNDPGVSNGDAITAYDVDNDFLVVSGNVCTNTGKCTGGHGVHIGGDYATVIGNTIDGADQIGIYVRGKQAGSPSGNAGVTVSGNAVYNNGTLGGIVVRAVVNVSVTGNTVHSATGVGIGIDSCAGFIVSGNAVFRSSSHGVGVIDVFASGGTTSSRGTINGNQIYEPTGSGLYLDLVTQALIGVNGIYDADYGSSGTGITITSNASYLQFTNNYSRDGGNNTQVSQDASASNIIWKGHFANSSTTQYLRSEAASAGTMVLPGEQDTIIVSGSTGITTINGGWAGREVKLVFTGSLTVTNGSNLSLTGDFSTSAGSVLALLYDGSSWKELYRSA